MSGFVFGTRIRSSVSTFAVAALLAAAPALIAGNASANTATTPAAPAATTAAPATAPATAATPAAPKVEQKVDQKADAAKTDAAKPAGAVQVATTPKAEVTKTQADAVAKELGGKPTDTLAVQLGKYSEQMRAAAAIKDSAQRTKAVTEARQQLSSIGGKPVTAEQATKVDSILGLPTVQ